MSRYFTILGSRAMMSMGSSENWSGRRTETDPLMPSILHSSGKSFESHFLVAVLHAVFSEILSHQDQFLDARPRGFEPQSPGSHPTAAGVAPQRGNDAKAATAVAASEIFK